MLVWKKSYQIYTGKPTFFRDRAARRDLNLYRKSMERVIVVYTLKECHTICTSGRLFFFYFETCVLSVWHNDTCYSKTIQMDFIAPCYVAET